MRARVTVWTNTGDELESVKPDELTNVGESIHVYAGPVDGRGVRRLPDACRAYTLKRNSTTSPSCMM